MYNSIIIIIRYTKVFYNVLIISSQDPTILPERERAYVICMYTGNANDFNSIMKISLCPITLHMHVCIVCLSNTNTYYKN